MAQVGSLAIRNVALDYPAGGVYERGSDARLRMVVVNGGVAPDSLVSVSSPVATDVTISAGGSAEATGSATPEPTGARVGVGQSDRDPVGHRVRHATPSASPGGSASPSSTPSPTPSPTRRTRRSRSRRTATSRSGRTGRG